MSRKRSGLRKSLVLAGVLALVVPLLVVFATPASAATRCVNTGGTGGCYGSIQDAVNAAGGGDVINVYPGTYNESVDLGGHSGALTLRTVSAAGNLTPGTAQVNGGTTGPVFYTSSDHSGDITIDGFAVQTAKGDGAGEDYDCIHLNVNSNVVIRNVTASGGSDGIEVDEAGGNVTVEYSEASSNDSDGFIFEDVDGNLTVTGCTANGNVDENFDIDEDIGGNVEIKGCTANGSLDGTGIEVEEVAGNVTITDSTANNNHNEGVLVEDIGMVGSEESAAGADDLEDPEADDDDHDTNVRTSVNPTANGGDVTIKNCTTNDNQGDGISVWHAPGDVTISNCTAERNTNYGFTFGSLYSDLSVLNSVARNNTDTGVYLAQLDPSKDFEVRGSIICGNGELGLDLAAASVTLDGRGNWWGCAAGPWNPGCDLTASGIGSTLLVDPVIDSISGSATVPAVEGQPTLVTFQFSGGPPAVYLGEGPGDLHGDPRFIVGTDNGTVASSGFIGDAQGRLEVTLTPAHAGTATVYVDGPCGLDESIVLSVVEAEEEFVPEPGSVMLLASGLMGLAGYAGLRLRKK